MELCKEHAQTKSELETCKNKISVFEALMNKIDKELVNIKNDIKNLSEKVEKIQIETAKIPLKVIMIAVSIGAGVSTFLTFLILLITKLTGVL